MTNDQQWFWDDCFSRPQPDLKALADRDWSDTVQRLRRHQAKKVLDLGCGYGHWSIALARAGFEMTAVDISPVATRIISEWAAQERLVVDVKTCAVQDLDLPAASFDAAICNSVLDHLRFDDAARAVAHIVELLRPAGVGYLSFDGEEEEDRRDYDVLEDGSRLFHGGIHRGMLWRYWSDTEIRGLCAGVSIFDFEVRKNGRRYVWFVTPSR